MESGSAEEQTESVGTREQATWVNDAYCYDWLATFITSAATGRYLSMHPDQNGLIRADSTWPGRNEHFYLCKKLGWEPTQWALRADRGGNFVKASTTGGTVGARSGNVGFTEWLTVIYLNSDAAGPCFAVRQEASGKYLSVGSNGSLTFDSSFIGWNQAFRFSERCIWYDVRYGLELADPGEIYCFK